MGGGDGGSAKGGGGGDQQRGVGGMGRGRRARRLLHGSKDVT